MLQSLDPMILFIASNAIFIAIGAVFSTISNEIFSFEKVENIDTTKYASELANKLRKNILNYINASLIVYLLNLFFIVFLFLLKSINFPSLNIRLFEILTMIIFLVSISWLVIHIILLFIAYFKIRNAHFEEKAAKSSPKND